MINARTTSKIRRLAGAATLGVAALCTIGAPLGVSAFSAATASAGVVETGTLALDKLVLRSGKVIEGQVLRETATEVEFNVIVAGISAPATFKKSQIIEIVRGDTDPADAIEPEEIDDNPLLNGDDSRTIEVEEMASIDSPKVYVINLKGEFGKEISPTPVRDAVKAAEKEQPDFLIVHLDNTWKYQGQDAPDELQGSFDQFGIADKIEPIFTKEIDLEWEKKPHVVFWVGNAMGGAAFLPFLADEVFYEPDGRIGGIGSLEQMFEGVGDEIVRQKQRSLRLARAQGLAIANGYDYRLINAARAGELRAQLRPGHGRDVRADAAGLRGPAHRRWERRQPRRHDARPGRGQRCAHAQGERRAPARLLQWHRRGPRRAARTAGHPPQPRVDRGAERSDPRIVGPERGFGGSGGSRDSAASSSRYSRRATRSATVARRSAGRSRFSKRSRASPAGTASPSTRTPRG